jgi:hypothetical protein
MNTNVIIWYQNWKRRNEGMCCEILYSFLIKVVWFLCMYFCRVSNPLQYTFSINYHFNLKLVCADFCMWQWCILSAIDLGGTKYVNLNDPITLTCNATFGKDALSSAQVDWFFNGEIIKSGDARWLNRLRIAQYIASEGRTIVSQLHISRSLKRDDGQYVCRTINYMNGRQETDSMDVIVLNSEYSQLLDVTEQHHSPNHSKIELILYTMSLCHG